MSGNLFQFCCLNLLQEFHWKYFQPLLNFKNPSHNKKHNNFLRQFLFLFFSAMPLAILMWNSPAMFLEFSLENYFDNSFGNSIINSFENWLGYAFQISFGKFIWNSFGSAFIIFIVFFNSLTILLHTSSNIAVRCPSTIPARFNTIFEQFLWNVLWLFRYDAFSYLPTFCERFWKLLCDFLQFFWKLLCQFPWFLEIPWRFPSAITLYIPDFCWFVREYLIKFP